MSPDKLHVQLMAYRDNAVEKDPAGAWWWGTADLSLVCKRMGVKDTDTSVHKAIMQLQQRGQVKHVQDGKVVFKVI